MGNPPSIICERNSAHCFFLCSCGEWRFPIAFCAMCQMVFFLSVLASLKPGGGGLWFFNTLFILSSIFLFYRWIWQRIGLTAKWMEALLIAGMFVCIVFLYKVLPKDRVYSEGLRSVFSYYPFYFLGVIGYKWEKLRSALIDNQRMFTVCLVLFCLLIPSFVYDMSSAINQLMKILLSCMAIPVLFYMVNYLIWSKRLDNLIQCFGRESLAIYVTHNGPFSFLLILTDYVVITSVDNVLAFLFLSLFSLFVCLSSIGIKRFFTLSEFFGFVLYGKRF